MWNASLWCSASDPPTRVHLVLVLRRPVVAERAVVAARDARHVAQPSRVDVHRRGERPWTAFRPSAHTEVLTPQRIGDGDEVVGPSLVGAVLLRAGLTEPWSVDADEPQPVLRRPVGQQHPLEATARSAMVVDDKRPVRVSELEVREITTVVRHHLLRVSSG